MRVSDRNDKLPFVVGKNVKNLRKQAGLTIEGLAFALSISISYTLMIERGAANISSKLAIKIAGFFDIDVAQIYTDKPIKLKPQVTLNSLSDFYEENAQSPEFFIKRRSEYSVATFLRNILLEDPIMLKGHTVGELIEHSKYKYKRELDSQELSRELRRLYLKDVLDRDDKFGNGSVYLYKLKRN